MSTDVDEVAVVSPALAGLIALVGPGAGALLLAAGPALLDAPGWLFLAFVILGWIVGYYASRALLRRLYTPR